MHRASSKIRPRPGCATLITQTWEYLAVLLCSEKPTALSYKRRLAKFGEGLAEHRMMMWIAKNIPTEVDSYLHCTEYGHLTFEFRVYQSPAATHSIYF
jgi:hypothetical protein